MGNMHDAPVPALVTYRRSLHWQCLPLQCCTLSQAKQCLLDLLPCVGIWQQVKRQSLPGCEDATATCGQEPVAGAAATYQQQQVRQHGVALAGQW